MYYVISVFSIAFEMQSSSVDIVNAERPLSQLYHSDVRSTTESQNEEHGGGVTMQQ